MNLAKLNINTIGSTRLHVDSAKASAANWLNIHGWVAGLQRDKVSVTSSWGTGECVIVDGPDVCQALGQDADHAWDFALHILSRVPPAPSERVNVALECKGDIFARLDFDVPKINTLSQLPFATKAAIALTQRLLLQPETNLGANHCSTFKFLPYGIIAPKDLAFGFDNTRIGNYHPDILDALKQPGAIGLDIGCGLRDVVYHNMVTQDIYPTPTASLITRPEDQRLPFADGVFHLIVLDSCHGTCSRSGCTLAGSLPPAQAWRKGIWRRPFSTAPAFGATPLFQLYPLWLSASGWQSRFAPRLCGSRTASAP